MVFGALMKSLGEGMEAILEAIRSSLSLLIMSPL
jgi:hypothetical protein